MITIPNTFRNAYNYEGYIGNKRVAVQIFIDVDVDGDTYEAVRKAVSHAGDVVTGDVFRQLRLHDPEEIEHRQAMNGRFHRLFAEAGVEPIYLEEIPNRYDSGPYSVNRPWYRVTTPVGHFVLGWRKRVIQIDWSETTVKSTAAELFPGEDVTKGDRMIHAWGYQKAAEYLKRLHAPWED